MKTIGLAVIVLLGMFAIVTAQDETTEPDFRVFDGKGSTSSVDAIVKAVGENDVVFIGELHDDGIAHKIQLEIFRRALADLSGTRKVALSLEMFERDVQTVLDEYLGGLISEQHFMASSRPWSNYRTDYRPLVEMAKQKGTPVIAANAPRRYVNMVSRNGRGSLGNLSKQAKGWLAPLPFAEPSVAYSNKFKALMGPSTEAQMGLDNILASQALWDATMADAVAEFLKENKKPLVIHLNGSFHSESRLGTVEHLLKYRPKTRVLVVTIRYENDFNNFDKAKHTDLGDFVILTDAKQPRGFKR